MNGRSNEQAKGNATGAAVEAVADDAPPHQAAELPTRLRLADASALLRSMANPLRLRVLCLLADGERSVGEINAMVGLSSSALSQHLARLRAEGLVDTRKQAQRVYYSLRPGPVLALIRQLHQCYCDSALAKRPL